MIPQQSSTKDGSPRTLKVVGMDPSLRNWGIAQGHLQVQGDKCLALQVTNLAVVNPELPTSKQVRQNSLDLESAKQLTQAAYQAAEGAQAIFVEVPVGSQSARAMASYGIVCGILGSLRARGIPFFEVSPNEVKIVSVGKKTATKQDMIRWALDKHPEANWPKYSEKGQLKVSEAKAEHMADAVAAIYAGIHSNPFRQMLNLY